MSLAFEQAGSLFTGWIRSCWACLVPGAEGRSSQRDGDRGKEICLKHPFHHRSILSSVLGVEREMQVCHTQPHLVPPMKLRVYDDLPSPSVHRQHRNSLSSWISEGRTLASRASVRVSVHRRRHSTTPLRIGAPTDFRRVQSFQPRPPLPAKYQPLELSIHRSGNRLSELPSFESFQLDELDEDRHRRTLAIPPRALSTTSVRHRRCLSSDPTVAVSRKPVGSGDRRSLRDSRRLAEPAQPVRVASALIPHFSIVNPVETILSEQEALPVPVHTKSASKENKLVLSTDLPGHASKTEIHVEPERHTPLPIMSQADGTRNEPLKTLPSSNDSPSSASSRTMPSRISSLRRPSTAENRKTIASVPLPNRMSQWFTKGPSSPKQVSLAGEKEFAWERTRTLSGTTVASTTTTITGGTKARNHNDSISSTITNTTTPRTSFHGPSLTTEKDLEASFYQPTIYEGRPQHHSHSSPRYDEQAIGLAF